MIEHPPAELFRDVSTPQDAWATAVQRATVDEDGRLTYWSASGQRGGSLRVAYVDPRWQESVFAVIQYWRDAKLDIAYGSGWRSEGMGV